VTGPQKIFPALLLSLGLLLCDATAAPAANSQSSAMVNNGKRLIKIGKFHEALPYLQKAVQLDPGNAEAYLNRGALLYRFDRQEEAMQDLDKCIALKGDFTHAYKLECKIYFVRGQLDKALEAITLALKHTNDATERAEGLRTRGKLYTESHQLDKALNDFNTAIAIEPKNSTNFKQRGNLYMRLNQYDKAIADYTSGLEYRQSESDLFYSLRAQAYDKIGRADLAKADRSKTNSAVMDEWGDFMKEKAK